MNDEEVLEPIRWKRFDNGKSYKIANEKYNAICKYIFPDYEDDWRYVLDGIQISRSKSSIDRSYIDRSYKGIKLEFCDRFNQQTQWRIIKFAGTLKDFKGKVLEKFEMLKRLKKEADENHTRREEEEKKCEAEIDAIKALIAKKLPSGYRFDVEREGFETYKLTLIKSYTKQELFDYINNFS